MSTNKQIIHFYRYLDYENLSSLKFSFNKPHKDIDSNIYHAQLVDPIYFYLPRSEILEVFQDEFSRNKARYRVDLEEHAELLEFCENLDALCINLASENSKEWFSKSLTSDVLIKYLQGIYDNIDEEVTIDIDIDNLNHLDGLSEYNNDEQQNLLIKIDSIEFYKQTFRLKISIDDIVDADEIVDEDSEEDLSEDEMNFSQFLEQTANDNEYEQRVNNEDSDSEPKETKASEHKANLTETTQVKEQENQVESTPVENHVETAPQEEQENQVESAPQEEQENQVESVPVEQKEKQVEIAPVETKIENVDKTKENINNSQPEATLENENNIENNNVEHKENNDTRSISTSEVINKEVVLDLAENVEPSKELSSILTKDEINEIESLISIKNREKTKYLINAERAEKASRSLFQKAKDTEEEIKSLNSKIKGSASIGNTQNI